MKRILVLVLMMILLAGCQKVPPAAPPAPPEQKEPVVELPVKKPEQESKPAVTPETEQPPVSMPETEVDPTPVTPPAQVLVPEVDWCAVAAEAYTDVTEREQFLVLVKEPDGAFTELPVIRGVNDWNVYGLEHSFEQFNWFAAVEENWQAQESLRRMSFYAPGEISFSFCQGGDVVKITTPEETTYLRAVNPEPEADVFTTDLYSLLDMVPEDAYSVGIWSTPVDGALEPEAAAAALLDTVVANYRSVPDWVSWKPVEVKAVGSEVFDVYRGTPEQFCFDLGISVKIEDPMTPEAIYWQAGSGLGEPDAEGFYGWGRQVLVEKNEEGSWVMTDWGTGGYTVNPVKPVEMPQLNWLVELFCLTEGFTHDHVVPYLLLELSDEEIATLPALLDQLTEREARELCATLGSHLRENDSWRWSIDLLKPLLGDYGIYLGA
ncbi:MAG: hypothetical protein IKU81_08670 [Oscillibacter sp.]|nr:hypothetical protein [Oscillibacter sp.]